MSAQLTELANRTPAEIAMRVVDAANVLQAASIPVDITAVAAVVSQRSTAPSGYHNKSKGDDDLASSLLILKSKIRAICRIRVIRKIFRRAGRVSP